MKHIKKLIISNFQSHKYSELEFGQELNVIVGPSDSGKTSIIRALKWVLYNEPSGNFFIREGESEASVTIKLSDNTILKRYRTKSKNGYQLITSDGVESIFEGIGTTVPQEITDITGISKMLLDGDHSNAINLGEQLEGPFLLSEKTSTRANAIGRLVGVDIVDEALREVLRDIRNINATKSLKEESIKELNNSIEKYDYIDELKIKYNYLKLLLNTIKKQEEKKKKLEDISVMYNKLKIDLNKWNNILLKLKYVDIIDDISINLKSKLDNYIKYNYLKLKIANINNSKEENDLILSKMIYLDNVENNLPKLNEMYKIYSILNLFRVELKDINKTNKILLEEIDLCKYLDTANNTVKDSSIKIDLYNRLLIINKELLDKKSSLKKGEAYLRKINTFLKKEETISFCNDKIKLLERISKSYKKLKKASDLSSEVKISVGKTNNNLKETLEKYSNILDKVGICPYCLSEIDDKAIRHVIEYHIGG